MSHNRRAPDHGRPLTLLGLLPFLVLFTLHPDPNPTAPLSEPVAEGLYWMEAECGAEGEEWQPDTSAQASRGAFVYFPGNGKFPAPRRFGGASQLTFTVDVAESADYVLYFRLNSPKSDRNSMWVSVDNGPWAKFWRHRDRSQLSTEGFEWREVAHDGKALDLRLAAGTHVIRVAARETGTQLDKILLAPVGTIPEGVGATAATCAERSASTLTSLAAGPARFATLAVFPNPVGETLTIQLPDAPAEAATIKLSAADGRVCGVYHLSPQQYANGRFTLPADQLKPGVYAITLTTPGSGRVWSATVVKRP